MKRERHIKAPWSWELLEDVVHVFTKANDGAPSICKMVGPNREANARRIVACVNALEGIPTSQIEKAGTGLMSDCAVYAAELYNQRDILLEALERIVDLGPVAPAGLGDAVRIASEATEQVKEKIDD